MLRIVSIFTLVMSLVPVIASPQEQDGPTVASEGTIDEASLAQLFSAFKKFDGKIVRFQGQLYWNSILEDEWYLFTESGLVIQITLDDGRRVTQIAEKCGEVRRRSSTEGCAVAMDVELDLKPINRPNRIAVRGVGFNVEFK